MLLILEDKYVAGSERRENGSTDKMKIRRGLFPYCSWENEFQGFRTRPDQKLPFCDMFKTLQTPDKKCYTFNSQESIYFFTPYSSYEVGCYLLGNREHALNAELNVNFPTSQMVNSLNHLVVVGRVIRWI